MKNENEKEIPPEELLIMIRNRANPDPTDKVGILENEVRCLKHTVDVLQLQINDTRAIIMDIIDTLDKDQSDYVDTEIERREALEE